MIALGAGTLAPFASFAQQPGNIWRIGYLAPATAAYHVSRVEAVRSGLRDRGYVEGKNLMIEYRFGDAIPECYPDLAAERVRLNVDLIVTGAGVLLGIKDVVADAVVHVEFEPRAGFEAHVQTLPRLQLKAVFVKFPGGRLLFDPTGWRLARLRMGKLGHALQHHGNEQLKWHDSHRAGSRRMEIPASIFPRIEAPATTGLR